MDVLKKVLLKSKFGQTLRIIKNLFVSKKFREWQIDCFESHSVFMFQEYGTLNEGKNLYIINDINLSSGFFYSWCQACRGLIVAERYGFTPIIDWTKGPYYDEKGRSGIVNPFEYFFEPVSDISLNEAMQSQNVVFYDIHTSSTLCSEYEYRSDKEIEYFAEICKKRLHIRKDLCIQLQKEISDLIGEKKTLAIHVRGVEWGNVKGHPIPASLNLYTNNIDEVIDNNGFEQIFLATDSDDTVSYFKNRYGDAVVFYNDVIRAKAGSKVLAILDESIDIENKGFRMGYEVLRDMLTISSCDGIIAGLSYVSFAAEVFKKSRNEVYEYKKYIGMKISKRGILPIDFVKKNKGK